MSMSTMKRQLCLLLTVCLVPVLQSCSSSSSPDGSTNTAIALDTAAATEAFRYLNDVRSNPPAYSGECNVDLSAVAVRPALSYHPILQAVAQEKALDMARRNYMAHQDPDGKGIDHRIVDAGYPLDREDYAIATSTSNYESLQMAAVSGSSQTLTGTKAIRDLIWDGGLAEGGHREHLLGIFHRATLDDAGIGFVRCRKGDMYVNYCCVIITKRKR